MGIAADFISIRKPKRKEMNDVKILKRYSYIPGERFGIGTAAEGAAVEELDTEPGNPL
jgi:hypothetical protein